MPDIRIECAKIVQRILEDKIFFGELKKKFGEKDLSFANMLVLTALRNWTAADNILKRFVGKKIPHKHREAEYLLKLAIVEILFMSTPVYAVINQTVKNIKQCSDKFLAAMANAVLRKISTQKELLLREVPVISSIPESFLPLLDGYSDAEITQIAKCVANPAELDITVKSGHSDWQKKFGAQLLPNGTLRIFNAPKVQDLPEYSAGKWWVQDVSASLPVQIAGDIRGKKVIDLCAAPGGKTAQLALKGANVTALDISESRLQTLKQNMHRLQFDNINAIAADAVNYMQNCAEKYDLILLDAPCSASGTFRRHPEVLYIKNTEDAAEQVKLQKQLLDLCPNILRKGGVLIYSVCSVCKKEGEEQIAEFLRNHSEFKRLPIQYQDISPFGEWPDNIINSNGEIRTMPYYLKGMDAFFICKMQRII